MSLKKRTGFVTLSGCFVLALCTACVSNNAVKRALDKSASLPAPVAVQRPLDSVLANFGDMVGPYVTAETGERKIPIEIDLIENEIDKDLPADLSQYARTAIEKIGYPFETFRTWPPTPRMALASAAQTPLTERQKPPQPAYRLVGSLLHASERVSAARDARGDGQFGGGHTKSDLQITGDQRRTITSLTIALTLEDAAGVAVRGATAVYRIDVEKNELNRSISVYVGGSGLGGGTKLTTTQNSGDALFDAMAISVVHLLGNALMIPYYRCSPIFNRDDSLERRERDLLMRLTTPELEQRIKRRLYVGGRQIDMHGPDLSDSDRTVVASEMRQRSLDSSSRIGLVELTMQLWESLDYVKAGRLVADRMAESAYTQRYQMQRASHAQAQSAAQEQKLLTGAVSPDEFGWSATAHIVVIDLSRIKENGIREKILDAVRNCLACDEVRTHKTRMLLGVLTSAPSSAVQRALRSTPLPIEYVWADSRQQILILLPK